MSFPITCTACSKTFTISDEIYEKKVAGRVVTIKCKSCSQGIRVDGTKGAAAAAAPAAPPPAPAAASEEPLWAVDYPDGQDREFTTAEVLAELRRRAIDGATLVWREGMPEWLELAQVPELASEWTKLEAERLKAEAAAKQAAAKEAAAKQAAAARAKPTPVHKPREPMPTVTGLAGLPGATKAKPPQPAAPPAPAKLHTPSSEELEVTPPRAVQPFIAEPRAAQPSAPELPKPRAAQPSAPVLPKAPPPPPAPSAAQPSPPAFAAALPAASLPLPPPEAATPPLPPSVAKVVSRPPEVQPSFPPATPAPFAAAPAAPSTAPAIVADHATVEWPESKSKKPLIVVGVLAVAAVAAAVVLLGGKDGPPPSSSITAAPPAPEPTPTPTAAPTASPAPASEQSGADTARGSDPVATSSDPGATPGAGFAELFAAGARKAEAQGARVAPIERFDPAATKAPLAEAAAQAQACKQSGGPTGKVTVVVTFDPSGKVSSATITEAPFAGTPTATCISAALKRASIPPFSGLPGTVSKTFSIL